MHFIFLGLVVLNLVGGFQALGTLLSVGLMMLPAAAARFWTARVEPMCVLALAIGFASCIAGLLMSYHAAAAVRAGDHPVGRRRLPRLDPVRHARHLQRARRAITATAPPERQRRQPCSKHFGSPHCERSNIGRPALPPAAAEPLKVVASFSIIEDFAKNVGGDRISLTTLVGPDGDAHVYEPKPADAAAFADADVVLVNGLHFEGFLQRLVEASATKATVVELTKGVEPIDDEGGATSRRKASTQPKRGHDTATSIRTPSSRSPTPRSM